MSRRACVIQNGIVTNVIVVPDRESGWRPPVGAIVVVDARGGIGDLYDGATFTPSAEPARPAPPTEPTSAELMARMDQILAALP